MRFILCIFYILLLSGCQSFIAYRITQPAQEIPFDGMENIVMFSGAPKHVCIKNKHCLDFRLFSHNDSKEYFKNNQTLGISFQLKSKDITEMFETTLTSINASEQINNHAIVLFPGYGMDSKIYGFQARWLSHFTSKDVILMPASNQYNEFKFGLNSLDVLQHYLNINQYQQIDILSYSMGSIAAMQLAKQISNVKQQIMVAPMVHFDAALMSVAKSYQPTLSAFVSDDYFKSAAENVISDSGIDKSQLDIKALLTSKPSADNITLYVSNGDPISPANYWQLLKNNNISLVHYSNLSHAQMVSLINQAMRNEILHKLI